MTRCSRCGVFVRHAAYLIDSCCVRCSQRERVREIAERQWNQLHESIVSSWVDKLDRDLDLLSQFDAFVAKRDSEVQE